MAFKPSRLKKGMSSADKRALLTPPSRTTEPQQTHSFKPPSRLPTGYLYVWNRLDREFEKGYDQVIHIWAPHEFIPFPEDEARWLHGHSILTEDSFGGSAQRALAIEGEKGWLEPLIKYNPLERIDREFDDNLHGWSTGGLKTRATAQHVRGTKPSDFPNYR